MALVLSAREAAIELKMRQADMLRLLETGEIPAYKVGRNWKVPVSVLEEYVRRRSFEKVQNTEI